MKNEHSESSASVENLKPLSSKLYLLACTNSDCTNCTVLKVGGGWGGGSSSSSVVYVLNFCIYLFNTLKHFVLHFLA